MHAGGLCLGPAPDALTMSLLIEPCHDLAPQFPRPRDSGSRHTTDEAQRLDYPGWRHGDRSGGFRQFHHAAITIAGIELMHRIHKREFGLRRLGLQGRAAAAVWNAVLEA